MKNGKFRGRNDEFRGKYRGIKFRGKTKIPRNSAGRGKQWALNMTV